MGVYPVLTKLTRVVGYQRIQSGLWWAYERISNEDKEELTSETDQIRDEEFELEQGEYEKIMGSAIDYRNAPLVLENISVPTLVLYGETEPFMRDHLHVYQRRVPDVEMHEIPDAGHNSHVENPDAFTTALREFLQQTMQ